MDSSPISAASAGSSGWRPATRRRLPTTARALRCQSTYRSRVWQSRNSMRARLGRSAGRLDGVGVHVARQQGMCQAGSTPGRRDAGPPPARADRSGSSRRSRVIGSTRSLTVSARPCGPGPSQRAQVLLFVVVEAQRPGDRLQDRVGGVDRLALLEARVVRHADPGQLGQFLAPQAGDPASSADPRAVRRRADPPEPAGPAGTPRGWCRSSLHYAPRCRGLPDPLRGRHDRGWLPRRRRPTLEPMNDIVLGDVSVTRVMEYFGSVELTPRPSSPTAAANPGDQRRLADSRLLRPRLGDGRRRPPDVGAAQRGRDDPRRHRRRQPQGPARTPGVEPPRHRLPRQPRRAQASAPRTSTSWSTPICTIDHVGWNTRLDDGHWVPTFPNATYLMPRARLRVLEPRQRQPRPTGRGNQNVFEDSVAPVHQAGLVELWDDSYRDRREPATRARSRPHPGLVACSPSNPAPTGRCSSATCCTPRCRSSNRTSTAASARTPPQARATRRRLLGRAADTQRAGRSPRTSAVTAPPRSRTTATGSRSSSGPASRPGSTAAWLNRSCRHHIRGAVRGRRTAAGAVFLGIPYAAAPAGAARFAAPAPHPGWTDVRDATRPGPTAPQTAPRRLRRLDMAPYFGTGWVRADPT